jgi:NAD(P)-dependent dehydrogenase (short-subunit alcohol dehydrogenase family)
MEWRNQVAVVTGGARGIGRATARLLAQRGAAVCVNYAVHADAAEALVAEIASAGGQAIAAAADVADSAAVEAMVARTEAELGPVTILVNNAGVSWQGTLDTYEQEQVARMHRVNVDGVIHATRAVVGSMAGAALWPDHQYGLDRGDRHRAGRQCVLRGNEGRGGGTDAALCSGVGPARHHCERRSARLRPHRPDAAWSRRSGLAGDGGTLRRTSDDGSHR